MEFLTTYGWAILVVLVMIGALAYFGVINPRNVLPEKCIFSPGIGCIEWGAILDEDGVATADSIKARLVNGFGYPITIQDVTVEVDGVGGICSGILCNVGNNWCGMTTISANWQTDGVKNLTIPCPGMSSSTTPKASIEIKYRKSDGVFLVPARGEIQVKPI